MTLGTQVARMETTGGMHDPIILGDTLYGIRASIFLLRTDTFISIGQYCRITHRTLPLQKAEDRHTCHHCNVPPFMCVYDETRWFKQSLSCPRPEFCRAVWAGRVAASLCGQSGPSPHYPQSYTSLLLTPGCSDKRCSSGK